MSGATFGGVMGVLGVLLVILVGVATVQHDQRRRDAVRDAEERATDRDLAIAMVRKKEPLTIGETAVAVALGLWLFALSSAVLVGIVVVVFGLSLRLTHNG